MESRHFKVKFFYQCICVLGLFIHLLDSLQIGIEKSTLDLKKLCSLMWIINNPSR